MNVIDYRTLAEEWLDHVVGQYEMTHFCREDLALVESLLKQGFTLVAVRDRSNVLRIDFLGRRRAKRKALACRPL